MRHKVALRRVQLVALGVQSCRIRELWFVPIGVKLSVHTVWNVTRARGVGELVDSPRSKWMLNVSDYR